jgi:hypothetical protein
MHILSLVADLLQIILLRTLLMVFGLVYQSIGFYIAIDEPTNDILLIVGTLVNQGFFMLSLVVLVHQLSSMAKRAK